MNPATIIIISKKINKGTVVTRTTKRTISRCIEFPYTKNFAD